MRKTYYGELYNSFVRVNGYLISFVSLVVSLLIYLFPPTWALSMKLALPLATIFFIFIIVFVDLSFRMYRQSIKILPSVKNG